MENINEVLERVKKLSNFLNKGVTPYHAVLNVRKILLENGFVELNYKEKWNIGENFKGFLKFNDSSIFAFNLNKEFIKNGFKFIASHLDSPCLKIKTGSDFLNSDGNLYLNVEVYGGPILNTWLDRGLSIAGKVFIKSKDYNVSFNVCEKIVDFKDEIAFIANCPIHLNREINSGFALNRQKHMMPLILTTSVGKINSFRGLISKYLDVNEEDIIDFDLYLYDVQEAKIIGVNNEFIQSKKIDDLAMAEASVYSFVNSKSDGNKFICLFDGEEIGSSIPEGAYSKTLLNILNRIYKCLEVSEEDKYISLDNSFIISADMAHAYNSSYGEKFDDYNKCIVNKGVVIKSNCNKNYITTGETSSYFKSLCDRVGVPYQNYFNRSDILGGSTIGPIITKYVSIKGVDVGNPMFAMHSCRETAGVFDHYYMSKVFDEYFK